MLSAVIIILREVLEAALVISVLLASSNFLRDHKRWIVHGLLLGLGGALIYGWQLDRLSEAFDGVGQELANAFLLASVALLLVLHNLRSVRYRHGEDPRALGLLLSYLYVLVIVSLSITHEGAEVMIYLYGFSQQPSELVPVLVGSALGTGIGLSTGALFYYGLLSLPPRLRLPTACAIVLLIIAGRVSQAVVFLAQADWLPSQLPAWDSSGWLAEDSVTGQLLYALIGYEATPMPSQVIAYLGSVLGVSLLMTGAYYVSAVKNPAVNTGETP